MAVLTGLGDYISIRADYKTSDIVATISGIYNMTIQLQRSVGSRGYAWETLEVYNTPNEVVNDAFLTTGTDQDYRLIVSSYTSGTATVTLSEVFVNKNLATEQKAGFVRALSGEVTDYLDGTGNWSTPAGGGASGTIEVQKDDVAVVGSADTINWEGSGVTVTPDGAGKATVTIAAGAAPIDTVFGRTGTVVAAQDDYAHDQLSGLGDDDHTQYSLVDGTRAFTGPVAITHTGGNGVHALTLTASTDSGDFIEGINDSTFLSFTLNQVTSGEGELTLYGGDNGTGKHYFLGNASDPYAVIGGYSANRSGSARLTVIGDIAVSGTVDGIDVSNIEPGATADQTNTEILDAWETATGRTVTTDASKLDGIELLADVTDATNVDAAGAVMNTDTTTASMSFVIDEDSLVSDLDTKVPTQQSVKAYVDAAVISAGSGDVVGPASSTDQNLVQFNGTTGKLVEDSGVNISVVNSALQAGDNISVLTNDSSYLVAADVTFENLDANSDVGTGAAQVAAGDHAHAGTYEPVDATIIRQADVDDIPVNGATTVPVSSNRMYDHENNTANPHTVTAAQIGVEAGADVTDTANVTAAGALMDSEVTNLAQVKAFDTTDYVATNAVGALLDQPAYSLATANITGDPGAPAFGDETKLTLTATGDLTDDFDTPTGITAPADGTAKIVTLIVKQDGTGGRDLRVDTLFNNDTNWPNATVKGDHPVLTGAADEEWQVDIEVWQSGATTYYNIYVGPERWLYDGTYTGTTFTMATAMTTGNGNIWNSIPRFTSASAKSFTITAADIPAENFLNGKAPVIHFVNKGAGDATVVQGTGMTLDGNLVFAEDKLGSIVFHTATTATVIGGTA